MSHSITLNETDCTIIAAMAKHIAPTKDVRYYLRSVCLECTPRGWLAVASDGHTITVAPLTNPDSDAAPHGMQIIIPRDAALGLAKCKGEAVLSFELTEGPRTLRYGASTVELIDPQNGNPAGWRFPDWRHVVPHSTSGEVAQFNPDLVSQIYAVARAMRGKSSAYTIATINHNGTGAGTITFPYVDLFAVIMPWRTDEPAPRPVWVLDDAGPAAVAAVDAIAS